MRAIIIGAGRGQRLMPTTADAPKCFAEIRDRHLDSSCKKVHHSDRTPPLGLMVADVREGCQEQAA